LLHPAATPAQAVRDDGLAGAWVTADAGDDTQVFALIAEPATGSSAYLVSLTVYYEGQFQSALGVEATLTDVGEARYAGLFLDRAERDRLVGHYGFLAVPAHQVCKLQREGDELRLWWLQESWLQGAGAPGPGGDRIVVGEGEVTMLTATTDEIRSLLARTDESAFGAQMTLRRMRSRMPQEDR